MDNIYHFYITFNPFLNDYENGQYTQAHEFYDYLRNLIKEDPSATAFWGKIIAKERTAEVRVDELKFVIRKNKQQGKSTHLYISDFKNLWAGQVKQICEGKDFLPNNTLDFYIDKNVECWFEISDFTLVTNSHRETIEHLSQMKIDNPYHDLSIPKLSPFTTGIKYPALIEDQKAEAYFDQTDEKLILSTRVAATDFGRNNVKENLKRYQLPSFVYSLLPLGSKREIENAELEIAEERFHNLSSVAFSYLKAYEIIMNQLIVGHINKKSMGHSFYVHPTITPPRILFSQETAAHIPLHKYSKNFSIPHLLKFMREGKESGHKDFKAAFKGKNEFVMFILSDLQKLINDNQLISLRGKLAHEGGEGISDDAFWAVRNLLLGVGCKGLIYKIYESYLGPQAKKIYQVSALTDHIKLVKKKSA